MASAPGLALLIVDDDARMRELAATAAQRTGCYTAIVTTDSGVAALELLARPADSLPDVVLTDLSMPEMDGLELTRAIHGNPASAHLPVVMFSSSDRPNDREDSLAAGCIAFFEKPPSLTGLQTLLAGLPDLIARSVTRS